MVSKEEKMIIDLKKKPTQQIRLTWLLKRQKVSKSVNRSSDDYLMP